MMTHLSSILPEMFGKILQLSAIVSGPLFCVIRERPVTIMWLNIIATASPETDLHTTLLLRPLPVLLVAV